MKRARRYAIVDAPDLDLDLVPANGGRIRAVGELIKKAARAQCPVEHPDFEYPGPDILAFRAPSPDPRARSRNAVVMSNGFSGMIDRSPCGSGTCAIMALLHARGDLAVGEPFLHESIVGATFEGRLSGEASVGGVGGVLPHITGSAWITRYSEVVLDPTDPFPRGLRVADIW